MNEPVFETLTSPEGVIAVATPPALPTQTLPDASAVPSFELKVVKSLAAKYPSTAPVAFVIEIAGVVPPDELSGADAVTPVTEPDEPGIHDRFPDVSVVRT